MDGLCSSEAHGNHCAGPFGQYGCDPPRALFESALAQVLYHALMAVLYLALMTVLYLALMTVLYLALMTVLYHALMAVLYLALMTVLYHTLMTVADASESAAAARATLARM